MTYNRWSAVSIFFVSVAVIALQLMIMRALSVTHYYHFSYLVISTALLGFGASGTFLALFFDRLKKKFSLWYQLFLLLLLLSIPLSYGVAQSLPLDTQYLLYSRSQLLLLVFYNLLMFIPFFFGGTAIGFMITYFKKEVPELYAANLLGSGLGGISSLGIMFLFPAYQLPVMMAPIVLLSMAFYWLAVDKGDRKWQKVMIAAGLAGTIFSVVAEPPYNVDPYKELANFEQLERQGDAERIEKRYGPRGQIDVYSSRTFHFTLFAGPHATAMPPPQLALLIDGQVAGAIFSIEDESDAAIMDFTPQSLPYRMLDTPRVLILGEPGGVNVWLAKRMGAERITVVQTNPQLIRLMTEDLAGLGGSLYLDEQVEVVREDPRVYLERSGAEYDLIHIAAGESMAAGSGGLQGLSEDYLLTREAIMKARKLLSEDGLISITRGIQSPPRDNIKIFSLFADAVSGFSGDLPEEHLLMSRNYLAANTILSNRPIGEPLLSRFKDELQNLQLDPEYYPGIVSEEIDQLNVIDGPDEVTYSYIHHAIQEILFGDSDKFFSDWVYHVRSPSDSSPYFHDFFKWGSVERFSGDVWRAVVSAAGAGICDTGHYLHSAVGRCISADTGTPSASLEALLRRKRKNTRFSLLLLYRNRVHVYRDHTHTDIYSVSGRPYFQHRRDPLLHPGVFRYWQRHAEEDIPASAPANPHSRFFSHPSDGSFPAFGRPYPQPVCRCGHSGPVCTDHPDAGAGLLLLRMDVPIGNPDTGSRQ
jgi:hypothetical protein